MSVISRLQLLKFWRLLQGRSLFPYQFLQDFSNPCVADHYWKEKYYGMFSLTQSGLLGVSLL